MDGLGWKKKTRTDELKQKPGKMGLITLWILPFI